MRAVVQELQQRGGLRQIFRALDVEHDAGAAEDESGEGRLVRGLLTDQTGLLQDTGHKIRQGGSLIKIVSEEAGVQDETLRSARESVALTLNQYKAGLVSYINVVAVHTVPFKVSPGALQTCRISAEAITGMKKSKRKNTPVRSPADMFRITL